MYRTLVCIVQGDNEFWDNVYVCFFVRTSHVIFVHVLQKVTHDEHTPVTQKTGVVEFDCIQSCIYYIGSTDARNQTPNHKHTPTKLKLLYLSSSKRVLG